MFGGRQMRVIVAFVFAGVGTEALAHGPQMQISIDNGRIVTRRLFPDGRYEPANTPAQRVYEIPLVQRSLGDASDGWYAQPDSAYPFTGPGIATWQGGFATGSVVSMTFADGLKLWNGSAFVDPGTEQVDAYRGTNRTTGAISTDAGPFNAFSFTAITNADDEHKTGFFRLLGDGVSPNTPSNDGVYLLSLRLTSDQPGISPSEPYYFLLSKNASTGEQAAAAAYVNGNSVPDPAAIGLIALAATLLLRRGP